MFCSDFFSKTDHLTNEEQWAYAKLLMKTWVRNCRPFPDSDADLARVLGMTVKRWRKVRPRVEIFFDLSGGTWRQPRLEEVFRFVADRGKTSRSNGMLGGRPKTKNINGIENPAGFVQATQNEPIQIQGKKEEGSVPKGTAASAALDDPAKRMWERGTRIFGGNRSLLGKLVREHGQIAVIEAIEATEAQSTPDPLSYLLGCLRRRAAKPDVAPFGSPGFA